MKNSHRCYSVLLGTLLLFFSFWAGAQDMAGKTAVLGKKEKKQVVVKIIDQLKTFYVFPDKAERMGTHLKKWIRKKSFLEINDPEDFAKNITSELHSVFSDRHLRVRVREPQPVRRQKKGDPIWDGYLQQFNFKQRNFGFKTAKILDGNVGYLDFRGFFPPEPGKKTVASAMAFLENTDAMIIDMRNNRGGSPAMVQLVCSYFFDKKIHLNSLYWRRGNRTEEFWTLDEVDGKRRPHVPIFVLTSKRTFSGAEEFCYNLLTRKRATLIGEVTGGGANPGGLRFINDRFSIFIPTGRAINPITKTNWEGTGVTPHVIVDQEKAFDRAYDKAKSAAREFHEIKMARAKQKVQGISDALSSAERHYQNNQMEKGEKILFEAFSRALAANILNEDLVNQLGYRYMNEKKIDLAIGVFQFNVHAFPRSGNVYDSLAEAYGKKGNFQSAIENYRKSYELDPNNHNALKMIEKLKDKLARNKK